MLGMRTQPGRSLDLDSPWRPLYRAGGACAAIAVAMYVAALVLFVATTAPPTSGGEEILRYIDAHRTTYVIRQLLWLAPSLFLMVVSLALAVSLRILNRSFAAIAGMIAVTSWAVSFSWPTTGEGSLAMVRLSDKYASAATDAERASYVAGAEVLMALNDIPGIIGILQTLGILLISLLMLQGIFPRALAWLGVATGAIGIVSEALRPVLGWAYSIYGLLLFAWLIWVAIELWRLEPPDAQAAAESPL